MGLRNSKETSVHSFPHTLYLGTKRPQFISRDLRTQNKITLSPHSQSQ